VGGEEGGTAVPPAGSREGGVSRCLAERDERGSLLGMSLCVRMILHVDMRVYHRDRPAVFGATSLV